MHLFQPIYTSVFFVVKFHNLTPKKKINLKKNKKNVILGIFWPLSK